MGETLSLKVIHQGNESVVEDGSSALIGSDASATVRIVRPGISRKHAVVSHDGGTWKVQDAGSRNGTYRDGKRVQTLEIDGPTTVFLGHPTDGEAVSLVPVGATAAETPASEPTPDVSDTSDVDDVFDLPPSPPPGADLPPRRSPRTPVPRATEPTRVQTAPVASAASDVEVAQLTAAIRDQISAVKGLTWSVWAMIAVTAALIVLTLFVGILSN